MSSPASELVSPAPAQLTLELPAPPATAETPLVPVRMVNEYVYCPRLTFLEWVDSEGADSWVMDQLPPLPRRNCRGLIEASLDIPVKGLASLSSSTA
jgi:hypothetical protein